MQGPSELTLWLRAAYTSFQQDCQAPGMSSPTTPRTSDSDAAVRIALMRETTEAATSGAIGWKVRDRRLRNFFRIGNASRAFDSDRSSEGR